jgi:hypothetical protein
MPAASPFALSDSLPDLHSHFADAVIWLMQSSGLGGGKRSRLLHLRQQAADCKAEREGKRDPG